MYREDKVGKGEKNCTIIKITSFVNHKPKESIIKSTNIIEELKSKEKLIDPEVVVPISEEPILAEPTGPVLEEAKHGSDHSQKEMSLGGEEEGEAEHEEGEAEQ
jgi:hypothetical protein